MIPSPYLVSEGPEYSHSHLVAIIQKPVVEESVREEEIAADNGKVEKLTEHKSAKIDVVSKIQNHVFSA